MPGGRADKGSFERNLLSVLDTYGMFGNWGCDAASACTKYRWRLSIRVPDEASVTYITAKLSQQRRVFLVGPKTHELVRGSTIDQYSVCASCIALYNSNPTVQ